MKVFFLKPTGDHASSFQVAMLTTDRRSCTVFSSSYADHLLAIMLSFAIYDRRLLREAFEGALKSFKTVQK